jgi:hypothetical protein
MTDSGNVATLLDERARRLRVEVERMAGLPTVEWMLYLADTARKFGVEPPKLQTMIKAVLAEREKAKREEKAAVERTTKRRERRDAEDAKRREKEADRKRKAIAAELKVIAKLPTAEQDKHLVTLAVQLGADVEELRAELEVYIGVRDEDEIELWPEPVTTKNLLSDVSAQVRKYIVINDDSAMAVGLWVLFSWATAERCTVRP